MKTAMMTPALKVAITWLVGNLHVGTSNRTVIREMRNRIRKVEERNDRQFTRAQRHDVYRVALQAHEDNRKLYRFVMGGMKMKILRMRKTDDRRMSGYITLCKGCGRKLRSGLDFIAADLDGISFQSYYCAPCANKLVADGAHLVNPELSPWPVSEVSRAS